TGGNIFVRHTGGDEKEDLALARGEGVHEQPDAIALFLLRVFLAFASERLPDRREQFAVVERFRQEMDCSGPHRLDGHGNISMPRDKYDGNRPAAVLQLLLEIQSALIRELDVKDQARGGFKVRVIEKLLGGSKRFQAKPGNAKQPPQSPGDGRV